MFAFGAIDPGSTASSKSQRMLPSGQRARTSPWQGIGFWPVLSNESCLNSGNRPFGKGNPKVIGWCGARKSPLAIKDGQITSVTFTLNLGPRVLICNSSQLEETNIAMASNSTENEGLRFRIAKPMVIPSFRFIKRPPYQLPAFVDETVDAIAHSDAVLDGPPGMVQSLNSRYFQARMPEPHPREYRRLAPRAY